MSSSTGYPYSYYSLHPSESFDRSAHRQNSRAPTIPFLGRHDGAAMQSFPETSVNRIAPHDDRLQDPWQESWPPSYPATRYDGVAQHTIFSVGSESSACTVRSTPRVHSEGTDFGGSYWSNINAHAQPMAVRSASTPTTWHTSHEGSAYHGTAHGSALGGQVRMPSSALAGSPAPHYSTFPQTSPHFPKSEEVDFLLFQTATTPCLWGGSCRIPLDDISPGGLWRHLREKHAFLDKHARMICRWGERNECGIEMNCASLGNHIATVHLRTGGQVCPSCQASFTRADALSRHVKKQSCHWRR